MAKGGQVVAHRLTLESSIDKMSHARDTKGMSELIAAVQSDINDAKKAICNIDSIRKVVNKYWIGEDANKFLKQLEEKAKEVKSTLTKYANAVETNLNADTQNFTKMQSNNANMI